MFSVTLSSVHVAATSPVWVPTTSHLVSARYHGTDGGSSDGVADADRDGEREAERLGERDWLSDGDSDWLSDGLTDGETDADSEIDGDADADSDRDGLRDGEADSDRDGETDADADRLALMLPTTVASAGVSSSAHVSSTWSPSAMNEKRSAVQSPMLSRSPVDSACSSVWRTSESADTSHDVMSVVPSRSSTVNVAPGSIEALALVLALSDPDLLALPESDSDRDGETDTDGETDAEED